MKINTGRLLELTLVFFVSLLSFSIGTYVGKKYSDNQHRLAQLEPKKDGATDAHAEASPVEHGQDATAEHKDATSGAITDEDVAKMAEEFAADDESEAKPIKEVVDHTVTKTKPIAVIAKTAPTPEHKTTTTPTATEPAKKATASAQTESAKPRAVASIPDSAKSSGSFYTVQIGSYGIATDAEKITDSLKARGYKATYTAADVNGKTYYRVQVGQFENLQEAQDHKKELMEQNRLPEAFVQRIKR